jgi:predicted nucleic acid-binding protein
MATLVDTNILFDLLGVGSSWETWSAQRLLAARSQGAVVINAIIFAEMAAGFDTEPQLEAALGPTRFVREDLPFEAGWLAGRAFVQYRRQGGEKRSPLPDFYIGAHALVAGHRLLTRDPARYRSYFPMLDIIAPDTHP